ncbi:c-type cytochrome [Magnetospirillum fulvum]|uniref:Cytochrome c553 n=1 Tax=Magnetospirillum fulvum TaxID=1082 RepID=A0A1H6JPG7_MAGFU|nr:c-type cytochrome [Magnetospirillum fulvum]SEH61678.1 Cytochrome c553 [Magnetospirillum fulvum]
MRLLLPLAILAATLAVGTAHAADLPAAAAVCANCHGTDGRKDGPIPAIAGKPAVLIASKLRDFKADKIANATVMPRLVKGLTEAEIDTVATYFAAIR